MDISTTSQLQKKYAEECYAGPAQLLIPDSPLRYFERIKRLKGLPEKDSTPEGSDLRIGEYILGGPFLINLPVFTGGLYRASPLALSWNNGGLAKDIRCRVENYHVVWYQISAITRTRVRKVEPQGLFFCQDKDCITSNEN